ncbi:universal stress protein [Streptomyces sp. RB6PN25]|uniref:Universal stress protein n=1 Tax=Streptomyces humicola TaxID=2953240 RepID=A0ABT1Q1W0_9ACTN|nr:universal stress protein [Streptomyces humicola]MCQ4083901.1 universal stress protein [Streptomyces humicola]
MGDDAAVHGIVVGTDGSADADGAVDWAAAEAARRRCPLQVVHATGLGAGNAHPRLSEARQLTVQTARKMLDDTRDRVTAEHPGLQVDTVMSDDRPAAAVLAAADSASLAVLGTRGHGGFAGLLLGSVSLRVAAHVTCPLVVVRRKGTLGSTGDVVVAVQDRRDVEAIRFAAATARVWKASLRALHAWQPLDEVGRTVTQVDTVRELRHEHLDLLTEAVDAAELSSLSPDVCVDRLLVDGGAAAALIDSSADASLLVVAAHRPRSPVGLRLGPVVHAALHHAQCPVALVPDR